MRVSKTVDTDTLANMYEALMENKTPANCYNE